MAEPHMAETRFHALKTVLRVTSGNFLEMYDFFLFGIYAQQISRAFFPSDNPYASLMATFLSFAAGFAMRPIGALVLGPYVDRMGRRKGLILTLTIMAFGTILIAFVPSYATIGVLAPMLVVLGRLLQGFSAGVELGGVSVYLSEMATPGNKGFFVSWQSASQQVAVVVAALLGLAVANLLPQQAADDWGWRIPFFIGCAIVPFLYWIRRSLEETEAFAARKAHPTFAQIYQTLAASWAIVLGGVAMVVMTTVSFYLITVYTPTFGRRVLELSQSQSLMVTMAIAASNFVWLPIAGAVSDRIGRKPILLTFSRPRHPHCLSGAGVAGSRAELRADAVGGTVAVDHLRLVQWRDGCRADGDHSGRRPHGGLLARLQPRHDAGRIVSPCLHLADPAHWRQGVAWLLDGFRRRLRADCDARPLSGRRGETGSRWSSISPRREGIIENIHIGAPVGPDLLQPCNAAANDENGAPAAGRSLKTMDQIRETAPGHNRSRNSGAPLDASWFEAVGVNASAVERRAATLTTRRSVKKTWQAAWLVKALTCIDLTTLSGDDTADRVRRLCAKARRPLSDDLLSALGLSDTPPTVAAVCVYPTMVGPAVAALDGSGIPVASVATGFPAGLTPLRQRLDEIRYAVNEGAREIDIVITRAHVLARDWTALYDEIAAMREACRHAHLKTILGTGDLKTLRNVYAASMVAMQAGADFIKTSTGKEDVNATLPVSLVMVRALRDYRERTGVDIGFKPAGGLRAAKDALAWQILMKEELGLSWLQPDLFRIGASGLLTDIERQLDHYATGRYSAAYRHAMA